jgi:hypothetical protein
MVVVIVILKAALLLKKQNKAKSIDENVEFRRKALRNNPALC